MDVRGGVDGAGARDVDGLARVGAERDHAERIRHAWLVRGHGHGPDCPVVPAHDPAKIGERVRFDLHLDKAGEPLELTVNCRDVDEHVLARRRVVEVVRERDLARSGRGLIARRSRTRVVEIGRGEHVPGSGKRGSVCGVLLIAPLQDDHAHVERDRRDDEEDGQPGREEDEDLAALLLRVSC